VRAMSRDLLDAWCGCGRRTPQGERGGGVGRACATGSHNKSAAMEGRVNIKWWDARCEQIWASRGDLGVSTSRRWDGLE
jgi:hypothetical protein